MNFELRRKARRACSEPPPPPPNTTTDHILAQLGHLFLIWLSGGWSEGRGEGEGEEEGGGVGGSGRGVSPCLFPSPSELYLRPISEFWTLNKKYDCDAPGLIRIYK